jgi:hypothetical protein
VSWIERPASKARFRCVEILDGAKGTRYTCVPAGETGILIANARRIQEVACSTTSTIRRSSSPGSGVSDFRPVAMQGDLLACREAG